MNGEIPPSVVETPGGLSVRYKDSWLYSRREPRALPERSALSFALPERSLILVCSPLLGYGLETLLARLPESCGMLCVEADEALYRLSLEAIPRAVQDDLRFSLRLARSPQDLIGSIPRIRAYRRALALPLSGGHGLNAGLYGSLLECLSGEISLLWRNKATLHRFGRLWVRNILRNFPALVDARPLEELRPLIEGKRILVAGAGPSLERALDWLPTRRGDLFILAVDTALPALMARGLRPDAVVCLEGQAHNLKDFIGSSGSGIPLIADITAHPLSFRVLGGPIYPVSSDFADCALLSRMEASGLLPFALPPLGSVGVAALSLGLRLSGGLAPVYLTGLDFSYPLGKIHARGTPSHGSLLRGMTRLWADPWYEASLRPGTMRAVSVNGAAAMTDPVLSSYARLARGELDAAGAWAFDMRGSGLDLGIPTASAEDLQTNAPRTTRVHRADGQRDAGLAGDRPPPNSTALREFAEAELARARELRGLLAGDIRMDTDRLAELLRECDYLYLHFPDLDGNGTFTESALRRVSVEADSAIMRWQAAIRQLA